MGMGWDVLGVVVVLCIVPIADGWWKCGDGSVVMVLLVLLVSMACMDLACVCTSNTPV